jgi:hypothetical protein
MPCMNTHPLVQVLRRIDEAQAGQRLPVVVFDLDSTLFATAGRNKKILTDFADENRDREGLAALISTIEHSDLGWDIRAPLRARGVSDNELLSALFNYWKERFFTDEYVVHDFPNAGAVDYVRTVHEAGALVYYLTGRHVNGMSLGTVQSLTNHRFPYWRGRAILHLKPTFTMDDALYKQEAISDINSHGGEVIATFDNEPANCNIFQKNFPGALNFFVDTEHSPEPEPLDPALLHIPDFRHPSQG